MNSAGRCRVRDMVASCFNTCRLLPLDSEEEPGISGSKESNGDVGSDSTRQRQKQKQKKKACDSEEKNAVLKSCSHSFAEEDYIVFCFGKDGEIHMINDTKSSELLCTKNKTTEAAATSHPCIISRTGEEEMNSAEQSQMDSYESCDSNVSDTSTTSFAFPVLGMEWIGSPAHMPNSEKHDACRQCCKF